MGAGATPTEAVPGGNRRRADAFRKSGTPSDPRRLNALGPAVVDEARPGPGGTQVAIVRGFKNGLLNKGEGLATAMFVPQEGLGQASKIMQRMRTGHSMQEQHQ